VPSTASTLSIAGADRQLTSSVDFYERDQADADR
jgi:hypothetical protein